MLAWEKQIRKQNTRKAQTDLYRVSNQLVDSPFSEVIKQSETLEKFVSPKYLAYKGTKDFVTHVILFKTIMFPFNIPRYKRQSYANPLQPPSTIQPTSHLKPSNITSFVELVSLFVTYYANKKPLKKESHHLFSIVQNIDKSIKAFMKRFHVEKIEISDCPYSITVKEFRQGVLRSFDLFVALTKMTPQTMEEAYEEAQKFVNLERELKPIKEMCSTTPMIARGNEKRELSLEKPKRLEYQANKRFFEQSVR